MKTGTLFIAPLGARNKKEAVFEEIVSLHPENDFSQVLYLAPNATVLASAKRQFFSWLKGIRKKSAYIPFQALTIKQLAVHLYETNPPNNIISERMRTLILCEVIKEQNIGYAQLLSDLYRKIRHYVPEKNFIQVKEDISKLIFEEKTMGRAVKALDILQSYESVLKEKGLADPDDMLMDCLSIINRSEDSSPFPLPPSPLPLKYTLVIDGFFDPTPLEMEFIKTLTAKAGQALILAEEDTELLRYVQTHKEGFMTKKLKRSFFRENTGYYSYPSMEEEVEGIAKEVKQLILDGMEPREIAVCFPSLAQYLPMLQRVFRKHGIPVSAGEYNLSATRPLTALEELLACIENDYPRNDFLSLITSPCLPLIPEIVKDSAVAYSYRSGIVKGKEFWLFIEGILRKTLGEDSSEEQMKRLAEFQKGITQVIDMLENIRQAKDILSFADAVESALDKYGFFDYLSNEKVFHGTGISEQVRKSFSELRQFAGMFGARQDAAPAFYLRHILQDAHIPEDDMKGVKILPFELAAGLEAKALFFGGMTEEAFPSRPGIDPILPEKVKKQLGMPHLEYYLHRQKLYFRRLLNVPVFEPYFSCPSADGDKIFLPSPFLDWENVFRPADLSIFTEEDVLVGEGETGSGAGILRYESVVVFDKDALGVLCRRMGAMSKGYFRVTDIDFYRRCPLRFYIEKVLGLEMEEPPKFEVESRLWGTLAHKTMEYVCKDRDWEPKDLEKRIFQGLEESLKEFPIGDFWSGVAKEIFRRLLPSLQKRESEIREKGFIPYMVEKTIQAETDGIRLKGKIDRVDKKMGQGAGGKGHVILLDYKTGSIDSNSLQLPLYVKMWQENFPESVEKAGYYSLKEGDVEWHPKKTGMEEFTRDALLQAGEIVQKMKNGIFPPEPANGNECWYCYHSSLCNI
jgi:ATP-dependent helicase/DNAse subunit B